MEKQMDVVHFSLSIALEDSDVPVLWPGLDTFPTSTRKSKGVIA
jgi:hypothetical protein